MGLTGELAWVKVPSLVVDLRAWKEMAGTYREDLEKVAKALETIVENHDQEWKDIQVVLNILLIYEEGRTVVVKAREEAERLYAQDTQAGRLEDYFSHHQSQLGP